MFSGDDRSVRMEKGQLFQVSQICTVLGFALNQNCHTANNFAAGLLIYPLVRLLFDLSRKSRII